MTGDRREEPRTEEPEDGVTDEILSQPYKVARRRLLDEFEARYLRKLFDSTQGNVARAARKAGMDRTYLIKLLQLHGIR